MLNDNDYDVYGVYVTLSKEWREYLVLFDDFENAGWGTRTRDYCFTHNLRLGFDGAYDIIGATATFCLDDVSFVFYGEKK